MFQKLFLWKKIVFFNRWQTIFVKLSRIHKRSTILLFFLVELDREECPILFVSPLKFLILHQLTQVYQNHHTTLRHLLWTEAAMNVTDPSFRGWPTLASKPNQTTLTSLNRRRSQETRWIYINLDRRTNFQDTVSCHRELKGKLDIQGVQEMGEPLLNEHFFCDTCYRVHFQHVYSHQIFRTSSLFHDRYWRNHSWKPVCSQRDCAQRTSTFFWGVIPRT